MVKACRLREEWLRRVADQFAPIIEKMIGAELPPFRVACGFPSSGGRRGGKKWTRGECWSTEASADGHAEIFINPGVDDVDTVAAILAHELIHAALGAGVGHKRPFQIAAAAIGHEKPFTSACPTDKFWDWVRPILAAAGSYPHKELRTARAIGAAKPQKGRNLKAQCAVCGYTVRLARKWIDEMGAPFCPGVADGEAHGQMVCEAPEIEGPDDGMEPGL